MSIVATETESARRDFSGATARETVFTVLRHGLHAMILRNLDPNRFAQNIHLIGLFPREMGAAEMSIGR